MPNTLLIAGIMVFMWTPWPNACVSDRRQRGTVSREEADVEAASCSLDAMVGQFLGDAFYDFRR
jgi:hypothetical protein